MHITMSEKHITWNLCSQHFWNMPHSFMTASTFLVSFSYWPVLSTDYQDFYQDWFLLKQKLESSGLSSSKNLAGIGLIGIAAGYIFKGLKFGFTPKLWRWSRSAFVMVVSGTLTTEHLIAFFYPEKLSWLCISIFVFCSRHKVMTFGLTHAHFFDKFTVQCDHSG